MSHFNQRKEKNCLNCNAQVTGRYCYVCGQENTEPKQSTGHLVSHFFNDITHFDGKLFSTLGTLIKRPGYLTIEYVHGRRASYLDPIRLYLFTSAIFFLAFYTIVHAPETVAQNKNNALTKQIMQMDDPSLRQFAWTTYHDSTLSKTEVVERAGKLKKEDITQSDLPFNSEYRNVTSYDSAQQQLPAGKRNGFFKRMIKHKEIELDAIYIKEPDKFWALFLEKLLHQFSKMLFVSLPFFAFFLKLLYIRKKQFYYTDHGIFSIHLYIYAFISLLLSYGLLRIRHYSGWPVFGWLALVLIISVFIYLLIAMHNFYKQTWEKQF